MFACLREPSRRRGAISIRHAPTLALSCWRTTPGLYSSIQFELGRGGCFRADNGSDGNLSDVACALNAAQSKAEYYVYSVLRPPRQPSPMRSRASASHCTTSRPPLCYRVSRYIIYSPPLPGHKGSGLRGFMCLGPHSAGSQPAFPSKFQRTLQRYNERCIGNERYKCYIVNVRMYSSKQYGTHDMVYEVRSDPPGDPP